MLLIPIAGRTLTIRPFEEILEHFSKTQPPHQLEGKIQATSRKLFVFEDAMAQRLSTSSVLKNLDVGATQLTRVGPLRIGKKSLIPHAKATPV